MCANVLHDRLPYSDFRKSTLVLYLAFAVCTAMARSRVGTLSRFALWPGPVRMWTNLVLSLDVRGGGDSGDPEISREFVMGDYRIRRPDGNPLTRWMTLLLVSLTVILFRRSWSTMHTADSDYLEVLRAGTKPTREIGDEVGISRRGAHKRLETLVEAGLVQKEKIEGNAFWSLTDQGRSQVASE